MLKKAMKMKKLRQDNQHSFFNATFYKEELCRYVMAHFLYQDVERLAKKHNVKIDYCRPGTEDYERFGCNCFIVLSAPDARKEYNQDFLFDPVTLMI